MRTTEANRIYSTLLQGSDGFLYGTAFAGGQNSLGTIFKLALDGSSTTVLHSFTSDEGSSAVGGVIQATDGNFYGALSDGGTVTTPDGTAGHYGGIYRYGPQGFSIIHRFLLTDGAGALAAPLQADDGNLYGTTETAARPTTARSTAAHSTAR